MVRIGPGGGGGSSDGGSTDGTSDTSTDQDRRRVERVARRARNAEPEPAPPPEPEPQPRPDTGRTTPRDVTPAPEPAPTRVEQGASEARSQQADSAAEAAAEESGAPDTRVGETAGQARQQQLDGTAEAGAAEQGQLRETVADQTSLNESDIRLVERTRSSDPGLYWSDRQNDFIVDDRPDTLQPELTNEAREDIVREQFVEQRQEGERTAAMTRLDREDTVPLSPFGLDEIETEATGDGVSIGPTEEAFGEFARGEAREQAADEFGVSESEVQIEETESGFRATTGGEAAAGAATAQTPEQSFLDDATFGLTERAREENLTPEPGRQAEFLDNKVGDLGFDLPTQDEFMADVGTAAEGAFATAGDLNDRFSTPGVGFGDSFEETAADIEGRVPGVVEAGAEFVGAADALNNRFTAPGISGPVDSFEATADDIEARTPDTRGGVFGAADAFNDRFTAPGISGPVDSFEATADDINEEVLIGDARDVFGAGVGAAQAFNERFSAPGMSGPGESFEATVADAETRAPAAVDAGVDAAETAVEFNNRFSVNGGVFGSLSATADDVGAMIPSDGPEAVEMGADLNDRFTAPGFSGPVDSFEATTDDLDERGIGREELAAAGAAGVAVPEPTTSVGGAAVLGGLAVAGVAFDTARRRGVFDDGGELEPAPPETERQELEISEPGATELAVERQQPISELEVTEPFGGGELDVGDPFGASELDIGGTGTDDTGGRPADNSVVPGDYPLPGRDLPADPARESGRETRPQDILDDTFGTAPAGQQQTGQQRQEEEDPLNDLLRDFEETQQRRRRERARARERELGGAEEAIGRREQRRRRAQELPLVNSGGDSFLFDREFPTGASAVVGREIARTEAAQQPELAEDVGQRLGSEVGQAPLTDVFAGVGTAADTRLQQRQGLGLQPQQTPLMRGFQQQAVQQTVNPPGYEYVEQTLPENAFGFGVGVGQATDRPRLPGVPGGGPGRAEEEPPGFAPITPEFVNPIVDVFSGGYGGFGEQDFDAGGRGRAGGNGWLDGFEESTFGEGTFGAGWF